MLVDNFLKLRQPRSQALKDNVTSDFKLKIWVEYYTSHHLNYIFTTCFGQEASTGKNLYDLI